MAIDASVTIQGIQELQDAMLRTIAALQPEGEAGESVKYGTTELHRYAVAITHVWTGALRGSHEMALSEMRGTISVNPGTTNPRTGERPIEYAVEEHERGGSHAFYYRTVRERGESVLDEMGKILVDGVS